MNAMRISAVLVLIVLLSGCALPSIEKVQRSFLQEHPDATVLGMSEQITNRFYAQFHIYYLRSRDSQEHEDVWHYHHATEAWVAGTQESLR